MGQCVEVPEADAIVVEVCKQGPAGPPGSDQTGPITVAPAATEVVDSFSSNAALRAIWFVTGTDPNMLQYSKTVDAHWDRLGNTTRVVYSQYGEYPGFDVLVTDNAGTIELRVTNNHTLNITVRSVRLQVL